MLAVDNAWGSHPLLIGSWLSPEQVAERYWLRAGHGEVDVLRPLLLGKVQALQGLQDAPQALLLLHAVYLQV